MILVVPKEHHTHTHTHTHRVYGHSFTKQLSRAPWIMLWIVGFNKQEPSMGKKILVFGTLYYVLRSLYTINLYNHRYLLKLLTLSYKGSFTPQIQTKL